MSLPLLSEPAAEQIQVAQSHMGLPPGYSDMLNALPGAIYATDPEGRLTFYNEAAANLWGFHPTLGEKEWYGAWRLYWPDGRPMPFDECPMASALKQGRPINGAEAITERPDGTRISFLAYPTPLRDEMGGLLGALNMLVDITERKRAQHLAAQLALIVETSDDAIISKNLDGTINTWNRGAERLFGYTKEEIVGKSVKTLIPEDRHDEEPEIISRIRRGERIDPYETVRQRKDGSLVDISLSVSPIKDSDGRIVGASKIARDITDRKRHQVEQDLLFAEMSSSHQEPICSHERPRHAECPRGQNASGHGRSAQGSDRSSLARPRPHAYRAHRYFGHKRGHNFACTDPGDLCALPKYWR